MNALKIMNKLLKLKSQNALQFNLKFQDKIMMKNQPKNKKFSQKLEKKKKQLKKKQRKALKQMRQNRNNKNNKQNRK